MSKSLGNFYTLRDVLAKGYSGREVRYALMRVHYRAPLNFTWEGMEEARQSLARIDEWLRRLRETARAARRATSKPEVEIEDDKFAERWMTISISRRRSDICSNQIRERIASWMAGRLDASARERG